jgi:hypothetical protein
MRTAYMVRLGRSNPIGRSPHEQGETPQKPAQRRVATRQIDGTGARHGATGMPSRRHPRETHRRARSAAMRRGVFVLTLGQASAARRGQSVLLARFACRSAVLDATRISEVTSV